MPVIPATQEAEAGESLELGRWRLQRAEIAPLHSSLSNRVRPYLKKKDKKKKRKEKVEKKRKEKKKKKGEEKRRSEKIREKSMKTRAGSLK